MIIIIAAMVRFPFQFGGSPFGSLFFSVRLSFRFSFQFGSPFGFSSAFLRLSFAAPGLSFRLRYFGFPSALVALLRISGLRLSFSPLFGSSLVLLRLSFRLSFSLSSAVSAFLRFSFRFSFCSLYVVDVGLHVLGCRVDILGTNCN